MLRVIVPKDITYYVDTTGKISYYAVSDDVYPKDANGCKNNVAIGDFADNILYDYDGPGKNTV